MRTKTILLGLLLVLPVVAASPLSALPMASWGAEGPAGSAAQRVCSAEGDFCAHAQLDGVLQGCSPGGAGHACTVRYALVLEGDGLRPGCLSADSSVTGDIVGCRDLPHEVYQAFETGEKTYHGVAPGGSVRETASVCVDAGAPARQRCASFATTVRFPEQGALAANATAPGNTRLAQASVLLCADASGGACAELLVSARVADCEGAGAERRCMLTYELAQSGAAGCATSTFGGTALTSCGPGVARRSSAIVKPVGDATRFHEDGTFCLDGAGGRCVAFGLDASLE